ncbi:MAG: aldo/keto reductase [Bacteroidetes bacterium]|nr:aldo/keto reductase [Bacteroidota bacterium]
MNYRKFGKTDLTVSEIGFGAWGIGGPSMAGETPIGWGVVDDDISISALKKSFERGINFYDTADFYGLGHSEELIGKVFGNRQDVIVASKVGHRINNDGTIRLDYSKNYILEACEKSLKRLKRDSIDYYQLHSAKLDHLENGECIEAMEKLKDEGKIRYWGLSLNTFNPFPEAEFLMKKKLGDGFQIVFNIINQNGFDVIKEANKNGSGIIARMPLQFGLLTGKFDKNTKFEKNDHRAFRLTPEILSESLDQLEDVWKIGEKYNISKTSFSLSFILNIPEISTVIPGIKTPEQAILNTSDFIKIFDHDFNLIREIFKEKLIRVVELMQKQG